MVKRENLDSSLVDILINRLRTYCDPEIDRKIEDHKFFLGIDLDNHPDWFKDIVVPKPITPEFVKAHYVQFILPPLQEGYADCFFEFYLEYGKSDGLKEKKNPSACEHIGLNQHKALSLELAAHKLYLSQKSGKDVGDKVTWEDFRKNYLDAVSKGYRDCWEENFCPSRKVCSNRYGTRKDSIPKAS